MSEGTLSDDGAHLHPMPSVPIHELLPTGDVASRISIEGAPEQQKEKGTAGVPEEKLSNQSDS